MSDFSPLVFSGLRADSNVLRHLRAVLCGDTTSFSETTMSCSLNVGNVTSMPTVKRSADNANLDAESLQDTAQRTGSQLQYISCNVSDEQSVVNTFQRAEEAARYPIRGLVKLTGNSGRSPAPDYKLSDFQKIMDVNVIGTFLCAQAAARIMQKQKVGSSIIMFASMSGTNVNKVSTSRPHTHVCIAPVSYTHLTLPTKRIV